jgi:hypothetical protein
MTRPSAIVSQVDLALDNFPAVLDRLAAHGLPACQVLAIKQRTNNFCGSRTGDREEKDHPARKRAPSQCHRIPRGLESRIGSSHQDVIDAETTVVHCTQRHDSGASFSLIKPTGVVSGGGFLEFVIDG